MEGFTCANPLKDRKDDYGHPDPCCQYKPCCPNPNFDHYVTYEGAEKPHPDPCCLEEPCPDWHVWEPPSDASGTGDAGDNGEAGADAQSSLCPGQCVPAPPDGWTMAGLIWHGPPGQEPPCPQTAPYEGYRGFADLDAPSMNCETCACGPPTGKCGLPSHLTASTNVCSSGGIGILTPFDAPPNWDGACTAQDAIPGGTQCNGSPCVKSLTSDPLTLTESGCTPQPIVPVPRFGPTWQNAALACQVSDYPPCSPTQVCAPRTAQGFSTCIFAWGDDHKCPAPYPEPHVFYDDFIDSRTCAECTCDPPIGGTCKATLSVYQDSACKGPLAFPGLDVYAEAQTYCVDLGAGTALGSKRLTKPIYTPGSCQPRGGETTGELALVGPATLCCLPS
jgi:hypothetical protein